MNEKRTRKKRAITIDDDGVKGTEVSLFVTNVLEPDIKITFLHHKKKIYKNVVRVFIKEELSDDLDVINYCSLLYMQLIETPVKRVSQIYQTIATLLGGLQSKSYDIRHLELSPYFQATIAYKGFTKFDAKAKKKFFENLRDRSYLKKFMSLESEISNNESNNNKSQ